MKKSILLVICTTVAALVQAVDFSTIRDNSKNMTAAQFDEFKKPLIGSMVYWSGWISEVKSASGGRCKVLVDMDPPGSVSVFDVSMTLPENTAKYLNKGQKINFSGKIDMIGKILGLTVYLENATSN
jgi:hypothetical protein